MPSLPTGENSKDIVSKLGERESAEGCTAPDADSRMKEGRIKREREKGGKIKNQDKMRGSSYSYRDREKSSLLPERRTACAAAIGKKFRRP